jgi:hypothetical protein
MYQKSVAWSVDGEGNRPEFHSYLLMYQRVLVTGIESRLQQYRAPFGVRRSWTNALWYLSFYQRCSDTCETVRGRGVRNIISATSLRQGRDQRRHCNLHLTCVGRMLRYIVDTLLQCSQIPFYTQQSIVCTSTGFKVC